ncbi:hypothetical protein [Umezawaea sp. NPDC059074]|uniref:hypothetical protein n=1 Tax=Umezawaea sp. NPDC059074 TaxID=3346716 RepID=UPI0036BF246D
MAAPAIPPIRLGLTNVEKPPAASLFARPVDGNPFHRTDPRHARAPLDGLPGERFSRSASIAA